MTKTELVNFFGSKAEVGRLLGTTGESVCGWPEGLTMRIRDRVRGAMVRKRIKIPKEWKDDEDNR